MTLVKAAPVAGLKQDLDRFFDRVLGGSILGPVREFEATWSPPLDFSETEDHYVVKLEVPGIPKENLDVSLEGDLLTVSGHRELVQEKQEEQFFWRERSEGSFARTLRLPAGIKGDRVEAVCHDGVMTVRLPKAEPTRKNKITVK